MEQRGEHWKFFDDVEKEPLIKWPSTTATEIPYDSNFFFKQQQGGTLSVPVNNYKAGIAMMGNSVTISDPLATLPGGHISTTHLQRLQYRSLSNPLDVIIEQDEEGCIARTVDIPLYGYGDDRIEAIEMLKREIESLYEDLTEDDNFSDEWIEIRNFLNNRIINDI